ncbi:hypothetical protein L3i22_042980 [Actinoplanes sp. L3-i22]|nr:hypothetical protein L3i22_042980 [Actinoplanes sp. L3-i22]
MGLAPAILSRSGLRTAEKNADGLVSASKRQNAGSANARSAKSSGSARIPRALSRQPIEAEKEAVDAIGDLPR